MWAKQGRVIKTASRSHLQGMELLSTSPLDSSPLGKGTGRRRSYFEERDPKQELFSEREQRGRRGRERGREGEREQGDPNPNHPNPNPDKNPPSLPAEQYGLLTK